MVYSNPTVTAGENECGISGHLHIFTFEALNNAFEVQFFQGFIFTPYHTDSLQGHATQIFLNWKHC